MRDIWEKLNRLKNQGLSTIVIWCPGHCDILYNDMADEEAKKSAESLSQISHQLSPVNTLDISTIAMVIKEEQMNAWQLAWKRYNVGSITKEVVPSVKRKPMWCGVRSVDISYARMLLNSYNLNDEMHREGVSR